MAEADKSEHSDKPTRAKRSYVPHAVAEALKPKFLEAYEELENQTLASEKVGISMDTIANWKKDPAFMALFVSSHMRAQQKNNDLLRSSMLQRGIRGNPHYLIRNGEIVRDKENRAVVAYYDQETQLTLFLAKNRMPDEFRDKFELEITGQIVKQLTTEFFGILRRRLSPAQLIPIQKELETMTAKLSTAA